MEEFNDNLSWSHLTKVNFDGLLFTWTNGSVCESLDRAAVNEAWSVGYSFTRVFHLVRGKSNHRPQLINCGGISTVRSSFRCLNVWRDHMDFSSLVRKVWGKTLDGVSM